MAPSTGNYRGMPSWVSSLMVAIAASGVSWALGLSSGLGAKIEAQTIQLAETKRTLDMLCQFMEEKKRRDELQDDRIRALELQNVRFQGR